MTVLLLALAAPSKAQQQISRSVNAEQSYDHLYAGFGRLNFTNASGDVHKGFGIEFAGSKSFGDNFHVWGNGGRASLESTEFDESLSNTALNIGVGTQLDASEYGSFFARAGFIFLDATHDRGGVAVDSESMDGYIASIGAMAFPIPKFGLSAHIERIEIDDENVDLFLGVSAQYRPMDEFTARAFIQHGISDDASEYNVFGVTAEYRFTNIAATYVGVTTISPDDNEVDLRAIGAGLRYHLP